MQQAGPEHSDVLQFLHVEHPCPTAWGKGSAAQEVSR